MIKLKNIRSCKLNKCTFIEPRIRRQKRATRESENTISHRRHDGTRQTNHHSSEAGQLRFPRKYHTRPKILHAVQALRGTTHQTGNSLWNLRIVVSILVNVSFFREGSLRLRSEEYTVRTENLGSIEKGELERLREHDRHARFEGHESFETHWWSC